MSENAVVSHPTTDRNQPMTIKTLLPRLAERGKIKIGMKGPQKTSGQGKVFAQPVKLDHFVVTTMHRGPDGNFVKDEALHEIIGEKPVEIPVRLLYDDPALNFQSSYACYKGRTLWCRGDGNDASRLTDDGKARHYVPCKCGREDPAYQGADKCKMNGKLSAIIDGAEVVGSCWTYRTTGFNSINNITSALLAIRTVTGGILAGLPLMLTVRAQQATAPDGMQQTIYVVSLEYRGKVDELRRIGVEIALNRATAHLRVEHIEDEARRYLLPPPDDAPLPGDDADEVVDEFYPEQAQVVAGEVVPPKPTKESIAAEIKKQPEKARDPIEVYDSHGEMRLSTTDEKAWGEFFNKLMSSAANARDTKALDTIIENNTGALEALTDTVLRDELREQVSVYLQEVRLLLPARRAGR